MPSPYLLSAGSVISASLITGLRSDLPGLVTAQVTAPADGEIVFAGPFEGYGGLLILSPGEDYFVVIGGLGRLDATVGQHVLAGEPLGAMAGAGGSGDPVMYIELRQDNAPIDPLPWFAPEANG